MAAVSSSTTQMPKENVVVDNRLECNYLWNRPMIEFLTLAKNTLEIFLIISLCWSAVIIIFTGWKVEETSFFNIFYIDEFKKEILDQFYHLLKAKIIQPRFQLLVNKNNFISKDNIQLQDIQAAKVIYFYEIIYPI